MTMPTTTVAPDPDGLWTPAPGTSWQWQVSGTIDTSFDVDVYDIDHEVSASVVDELHADGRRVICYLSAGTAEDYRLFGSERGGWRAVTSTGGG
ncbi:MAG: endo alpha-1,4 polygalactosaminidase [Actinomycetota bacterium]|nr:endo alpha-1,4 polygalactosaminidase [Actinomycetota bacterium]